MPYLAAFWHVLPEAAPASEWDELLIYTEVFFWAEQHHQAVRPHIPYLAEDSQLVFTVSGSGELVVKTQRPGDVIKSLVGHRSPENAPS